MGAAGVAAAAATSDARVEMPAVAKHRPTCPSIRSLTRVESPVTHIPGIAAIACILALVVGGAHAQATAPKEATDATRAANRAQKAELPLADRQSFDDAARGLIEPFGDKVVMRTDGARPAWTLKGYEFLGSEESPDSVHPGLWRHARANMANGLFKVTERLYQVRGLDIANMTIVEGDSGLVVIDPLISVEVAREAMLLYFKHRPRRPVVAVIYTHSHVDHFGGARGVVSDDEVTSGKVTVWAPAGFMQEAVGENVIAGNAMGPALRILDRGGGIDPEQMVEGPLAELAQERRDLLPMLLRRGLERPRGFATQGLLGWHGRRRACGRQSTRTGNAPPAWSQRSLGTVCRPGSSGRLPARQRPGRP